MKFNPNTLSQWFKWIRKSPIDDMAVNAVKNNADDLALGALDVVDDIPTSISFDDIADAYKNRIPMDSPPITSSEFVQNYKTNRDNRRYGEMMDELFPNYSQIGDPADAPLPTSPPKTNKWIENYVDMRDNYADYLEYMGYPSNFDYGRELYDAGYKFDSTPDYDAMDIRPEKFGAIPSLKDSIEYPDGFTDPDAFARYYTALQQGYMSKGIEPYAKDFQNKPYYASFSLNKPKLNVVDMPELFKILYGN